MFAMVLGDAVFSTELPRSFFSVCFCEPVMLLGGHCLEHCDVLVDG
jgi:hypothetical protein